MWTDSAVTPDLFDKLKLYQKINHFPGMFSFARKKPSNENAKTVSQLLQILPQNISLASRLWGF